MFDTMKIARMIRQARIDGNMTQMNLADAMGVSYQAVSNWERGNSMPDISKLEQLCAVLHITVNELLGMEDISAPAPMLDVQEMTVAELMEAAPALPPADVKARMKVEKKRRKLDLDDLLPVAPFLNEAALDELLEDVAVDSLDDLVGLAPFLTRETLEKMVERCDVDDLCDLAGIASFLSKEALEKIVMKVLADDLDALEDVAAIAPFLSDGALTRIVKNML